MFDTHKSYNEKKDHIHRFQVFYSDGTEIGEGKTPEYVVKWIKTEKEIVDATRRSAQNIACSLFTDHPRRLQLKKAKERLKRFEGYLSEKIRLETERKQYERLAKQFGKAP